MKYRVEQLIEISKTKICDHISSHARSMDDKIMHYFQCIGCKDCDSTVKNRHLLSRNEKEFSDEIESLIRTLFRELNTSMDNLEVRMKTNLSIHKLNIEMDAKLKQRVGETIKSQKGQNFSKEAVEGMFNDLWHEATHDILKTARRLEKEEDIEAAVQATIVSLLGRDCHFYLQRHSGQQSRFRWRNVSNRAKFKVQYQTHMVLIRRHFLEQLSSINSQDIERLQAKSERIINQSRKYYDTISSKGKQFSQRDVEKLFVEVLAQIRNISDKSFKVTPDYQADLVCHIEMLAVAGFAKTHETYCNRNSPEALLTKKRKIFHDLFIAEMGQGDMATDFCDNVLLSIILKNIGTQLSNTELLHELRVHCGEMFRDIKSVQASIMVDLFKKNQFQDYIDYIDDYETVMKAKLDSESIHYFDSKNRLKKLAFTKLDHLVNTLVEALLATEKSACNSSEYFKTFFSKITGLKTSHSKIDPYIGLHVPDKHQFGHIVNLQLKGRVKERAANKIQAWDVRLKLQHKGLTEFLFKEIVGCTARCPFCQVPCDTHSGGKTHGNHSATLHRPQGLGSIRVIYNQKLVWSDCRSDIASDQMYVHGENYEKSTPYKKYYTIFPDWTIYGDSDPDVEKYWKWVFSQHNEDFAGYYSGYPAEIPAHWSTYEKQDISKDIEDHYYIKLDVCKL